MSQLIKRIVTGLVVISALVAGGIYAYFHFNSQQVPQEAHRDEEESHDHASAPTNAARLSPQAQKNLDLESRPLELTSFWRTIEVPGVVVDRPGISDRGVVAPVAGVITQIHHHPGDTIKPGSPLFSIRLVGEALHSSQLELFKATREVEIARDQRQRLADVAQSGALAQSRIIEIDNQIRRLEVTIAAYEQALEARGLTKESIAAAARGKFLTEFTVKAPEAQAMRHTEIALASGTESETGQPAQLPFAFELQELNVELGKQVEAGQVLCHLADHRGLLIEGHAFKQEMPLIQEAARNGWEVEVEFDIGSSSDWPPLPEKLPIHHVANAIDPESRTFAFDLLLQNQWQAYTHDGQTRLLWRLRPGNRVRLHVPVERFENVFVLPQEAIAREGPETFIFRQNGEFFDRKPVHVLYEDRRHVVVAEGGGARPGVYVAQSGAASIHRVMKAQASSGAPNVHVHADGTVHESH